MRSVFPSISSMRPEEQKTLFLWVLITFHRFIPRFTVLWLGAVCYCILSWHLSLQGLLRYLRLTITGRRLYHWGGMIRTSDTTNIFDWVTGNLWLFSFVNRRFGLFNMYFLIAFFDQGSVWIDVFFANTQSRLEFGVFVNVLGLPCLA